MIVIDVIENFIHSGLFSAEINLQSLQRGWSNSGATATQTISGDGYVEYTASETTNYRICGLSHTQGDLNYTSVDYGLYQAGDGKLYIYEAGISRYGPDPDNSWGAYAPGDHLRVAVEAGVVKYKKNGAVF